MTTQPSTASTNPHNPGGVLTDTSDMHLPHGVFRGELAQAPGWVRGVRTGDTAHATAVVAHVRFVLDALTHHHENEDELLWPRLRERAPQETAPLVDLMEGQHEGLHAVIDELDGCLARFAADASDRPREQLAHTLERAYALLDEHLRAEEEHILPLAARTVSAAEWGLMAERGNASLPTERQMMALGAMHRHVRREVFDHHVGGQIPRVLRPLVLWQADRAYRKALRAVQAQGAA